ncbi:hypothetical protein B0H21DRAFT_827262 [Amylocystis lapponica]|nr:hypothetical protein B0H21DRAFT_827262 [Amylocystis lapponica]
MTGFALNGLSLDIREHILDMLDFPDLMLLRAAGHQGDFVFTCHVNNRYNALLGPFVLDAVSFRAMLDDTESLVSGSVALAFFMRHDEWCPLDLDIFVPYDVYPCVLTYLITVEQYSIVGSSQTTYDFTEAIARSTRLCNNNNAFIDVLQCTTTCAIAAIPSLWSSHLMNFLAADSFACAYPTLTFQRRGVLHPERLIDYRYVTPDIVRAMGVYNARGFDFRLNDISWRRQHDIDADCERSPTCPSSIRFFGDPYGILGSFAPVGSTACAAVGMGLPRAVTVVWGRGGDPCGERCAEDSMLEPTRLITSLDTMLS